MKAQITLFATISLLLTIKLFGAAISSHFEVADNVINHIELTHKELAGLIMKHPHEFRTGSVYPDWGYLFNSTKKAAEASHWKPFHNKALCYIYDVYGPTNNWNIHAEKLFVFICGLSCHGTVDKLWHFGESSFLKQAEKNDIENELLIESITDIFVQIEKRNNIDENYEWWIPVRDMISISKENNLNITSTDIISGMFIQQLALLVEDYTAKIAYWPARILLPWTQKNYWTWHDGGLEHGAIESALELQNFWDKFKLIELGDQPCFKSDFVVNEHRHSHVHHHQSTLKNKHKKIEYDITLKLFEEDLLLVETTYDSYGAIILNKPESKYLEKIYNFFN